MDGKGRSTLAWLRSSAVRLRTAWSCQSGLTLIELLVAGALALVIAGGAMGVVIVSLHQQNAVSSSAYATQQAQGGLRQLVNDLREAQNIPDAAVASGNDTPVVVSYTATGFSAAFYLPVAGSSSKGTLVTWTCTAAAGGGPGACTRQLGAGSATVVNGVIAASITPVGADGTTLASCAGDPTGSGSPLVACKNVVAAGSPPAKFPTSVQLTLQVSNISQNDSSQTHTVSGTQNGATFNTSVQLRNYAT